MCQKKIPTQTFNRNFELILPFWKI